MAKTERTWNLTVKRFESIISKELPKELQQEFSEMIGHSYGAVEYRLEELFGLRPWLTKNDKVVTLQLMTKIFRIFRETDPSHNKTHKVFAVGLFTRHPGAFEIFESAPLRIQGDSDLYKYRNSRTPRATYTYLRLLQMTGFQSKYVRESGDEIDVYINRVRNAKNLTSNTLDFSDLSDWLNTTIAEKKGLDGFGYVDAAVVILMRSVYGAEKFESALRAFVDAGFHIHPDDLMTVLDRWDELHVYPGEWMIEMLGLENASNRVWIAGSML